MFFLRREKDFFEPFFQVSEAMVCRFAAQGYCLFCFAHFLCERKWQRAWGVAILPTPLNASYLVRL